MHALGQSVASGGKVYRIFNCGARRMVGSSFDRALQKE